MNKCIKRLIQPGLLLAAVMAQCPAFAVSISYVGDYNFSNAGGAPSFRETLTLSSPIGYPGSGAIDPVLGVDPDSDPLLGAAGPGVPYIVVPPLTLSESSYVSGSYFNFAPTLYLDGFKLYAGDDTLLFKANLTVNKIEINGSSGDINSAFVLNLTGISAGGSYLPGSSPVVDAFLASSGGAANFTLQFAGDLSNVILGGSPTSGSTYSGTAAPIVSVPDRSNSLTLALLGFGSLFLARRKVAA